MAHRAWISSAEVHTLVHSVTAHAIYSCSQQFSEHGLHSARSLLQKAHGACWETQVRRLTDLPVAGEGLGVSRQAGGVPAVVSRELTVQVVGGGALRQGACALEEAAAIGEPRLHIHS
jgi:hypothetical protein